MRNEVRIYDGQGRLKAVVQPQLVLSNKIKKFDPHICRSPRCNETTTNRHYCGETCRAAHRYLQRKAKLAEKQRLEDAKPKRYCQNYGCSNVLVARRIKFCSKTCCNLAVRKRLREREIEKKEKLKKLKAKLQREQRNAKH